MTRGQGDWLNLTLYETFIRYIPPALTGAQCPRNSMSSRIRSGNNCPLSFINGQEGTGDGDQELASVAPVGNAVKDFSSVKQGFE